MQPAGRYDLHVVDATVVEFVPSVEEVLTRAFLRDLGMLYVTGLPWDHPAHRRYVNWLVTFFAYIVKRNGLVVGVLGTPKSKHTKIRGHGRNTVVIEDSDERQHDDNGPAIQIVEEAVMNQLLGVALILPPQVLITRDMIKAAYMEVRI